MIDRSFRRVKQRRRVATRHEKKAHNFAAFAWIAAGITTPLECPQHLTLGSSMARFAHALMLRFMRSTLALRCRVSTRRSGHG